MGQAFLLQKSTQDLYGVVKQAKLLLGDQLTLQWRKKGRKLHCSAIPLSTI